MEIHIGNRVAEVELVSKEDNKVEQMERVRTAQGSVENLILTKRIQLWKFI
jgi:hypothetical protein